MKRLAPLCFLLLAFPARAAHPADPALETLQRIVGEQDLPFRVGPTEASTFGVENLARLRVPRDFDPRVRYRPLPFFFELPARWDWAEQGMVSPVTNQRNCGGCWAFATIGPVESAILVGGGPVEDLSEQALISCNPWGWGCNGGWWAFDLAVDPGTALESCQPFIGSQGTCNATCDHPYRIADWGYVSDSDMPSVAEIKTALLLYGPLAGALHVSGAFGFYKGGVWTLDEEGDINHGVTIVGWDDSLGPAGAWRIKNSWGTGWGEEGFAWVAYGTLQLGFGAAYVVYRQAAGPDAYEPDNDPASAKPLEPGLFQDHTLASDPDWFHFSLAPGCTYLIYTFNLLSGADTIIELYDAGGSVLLAANDDCNGNTSLSCLFVAPEAPMDFTLKVGDIFGCDPPCRYRAGIRPIRCSAKAVWP